MYKISITNSINRILQTPLGSRTMRPEFGSLLYTLRDRKFDDDYKLKATQYTYEAIRKFEKRVKIEKVNFKLEPIHGVVILVITLANGETVEVKND